MGAPIECFAVISAPRTLIERGPPTIREFTARQALERKLIDHIGYLADATAAACQLAGQPEARVVVLHRCNDVARTPYAVTPNTPLQTSLFPVSIPGIERSRLPTFLYLWQIDPTLERLSGK